MSTPLSESPSINQTIFSIRFPHHFHPDTKIRFLSFGKLQNHWEILLYRHSKHFYPSTLDINVTYSTWDALIELMFLRFLVKGSYAEIYRLFRTFVWKHVNH